MKRNNIILLVLGIILIIIGITALNNNKKEDTTKKEEEKLENMNKDLNTELRSLLPGDCNGITSALFQNKKITARMLRGGTSSTCEINSTPHVYILEEKSGLSGNKAYIYDYILIYYAHSDNNKHWANTDSKYIYDEEIIEDDNAYPTDDTFHKYGKLYKHTFEKNGEYYKYVSTEPVK